MTGYILRRVAYMVPVLFLITLFTFFLVRLVPGDPVTAMLGPRGTPERRAAMEKAMKLDRPIWEQYVAFVTGAARGDLGDSLWKKQPVTRVLADRIPPTLFLVFYALVMTIILTLPLAGWAALNKGRWPDQFVRVFTVVSLAMPVYWIGLMLLQLFAVKRKLFPVSGWGEGFLGHLHALFLPALGLTLAIASLTIRSLRNAMLETMGQDFVRTARAKGIGERAVFTGHVLRNSALSTVTILGINLAFLIGGTTITETIFAIPGLGQLIVTAVFQRDYPVIQGVTLTIGIMVLLINLVVDLTYAMLDPRVSYT
ncbi:MAG: ABC transporter permease [Thermomicrobiales bacterium]|nr:ABC transporter permease [Thermomicrobiales bacterium]